MPEKIMKIVYVGISLQRMGSGLPVKRYKYYELDENELAIEESDSTFWFKKKLKASHSVGTILTVTRKGDNFMDSVYCGRSEQSVKISEWAANSRALEEIHRKEHYVAKTAKGDPIADLVDKLAERTRNLSWQERRAIVSYILERIL